MPTSKLQMILDEMDHARSLRHSDEAAFHRMLEKARHYLILLTSEFG